MRYLLVNHVPFGRGAAAGRFRVGDLFIEDLRAQARAVRDLGGTLAVACPLVETLDAQDGGSFNTIEIDPAEQGFSYVPLPRYLSMKSYWRVRRELRKAIHAAVAEADVVQMDYGGYPIMLGEVVWRIAGDQGKKRIWVFDGADPFPRLELHASQETNPLKRWLKRRATRGKIAFCRQAVRQADLVFAHNAAVVERFRDVWNDRCHAFDRSFVTDEILIPPAELQARIERFRDPSRPLRLMSAGRQIRIKGTDQVIEAVATLRKNGVAVELDILGDGADLPAFRRLAEELKIEPFVHFLGTVSYGPELWAAWARADVMTVTNMTAEISRNVLLSLARGLPLVTYENPGTDALLRGADAAEIVHKGNVNHLVETLARLAKNRDRLGTLAQNGRALAEQKSLDGTHRARARLAGELKF